jgi:streptomycin 3"-adenylyltransferase
MLVAVERDEGQPQLDAVLAAVRDSLGQSVVAAYLHGSAVHGGLRPRSDLDVLVVTSRPTTVAERRVLVDRLSAVSDRTDRPGFERPVELTILVHGHIRPWRYPPPMDFQYGEWLRAGFERGDVESEKPLNPDVAILVTAVLGASMPLVGPPAAELFDPVPAADLRRALTDELPSLLDNLLTDTRNIILTIARIRVTLATGEIHTKAGAADWVLARLPAEHRPVLARARGIYLGEQDERWDDLRDRLQPFVDHVIAEIRRA